MKKITLTTSFCFYFFFCFTLLQASELNKEINNRTNCIQDEPRPFITTWKTDNRGTSSDNQITIPTFLGETYNYTVDWGDGSSDSGVTGDIIHTYATPGTYTVSISGTFPRIYINQARNPVGSGDAHKILTIVQWGDISWSSMNAAFAGCIFLQGDFTDAPDLTNVTDMGSMFDEANAFDYPIGDWDVSNITDMSFLFRFALDFNQDLANWDVSNVTDMRGLFYNANSFNGNITGWDVSNVAVMQDMFNNALVFNQDIGAWDVSSVTSMANMFSIARFFNQNIGGWDVSNVADMASMFSNARAFNQDIGGWDVSNVTNMSYMFFGQWQDLPAISSFNQDIGAWNVENVTDMSGMFSSAISFDQDLADWNVGNVRNMNFMFKDAKAFNQDIGAWDVSKVESMLSMFSGAELFNQDLGNWNVSNVEDMAFMFRDAEVFDKDLSAWRVGNVTRMFNMFSNSNLSIENYDALLNGWSNLPNLQSGVQFGAGNIQYCLGEDARQKLIDEHGWNITDQGRSGDCDSGGQRPFITTWITSNPGASQNDQITIDYDGGNYTIEWGDGSSNTNVTETITHTYASPGRYQISISGDYPRITFANSGDARKFFSVDQWGDMVWSTMEDAFRGIGVRIMASDVPDLSNVISTRHMFSNADTFNQDISHWDMSNVEDFSNMFFSANFFNQDISGWDMSSAVRLTNMFYNAYNFDQDLGDLDISGVGELKDMFTNSGMSTANYDATLIGWSEQEGIRTDATFGAVGIYYCLGEAARQKLIDEYGWSITDGGKSEDCDPKGQRPFITTWKTDNPGISGNRQITIPTRLGETYDYTVDWGDGTSDSGVKGDITHTFAAPGTYTVSISGTFPRIYFEIFGSTTDREKLLTIEQWGDNRWSSMKKAFYRCSNLQGNFIDSPDLSNVTDMSVMFYRAESFDYPIGDWDVSNVEIMKGVFHGASSFNHPVGNWDVGNVTDMTSMFRGATAFNQDIGGWDVSNVESMWGMFNAATVFNQDIGGWDVSNVSEMLYMFTAAIAFDQNLGAWDIGNVIRMVDMFGGVNLSIENYDALLNGWSSLPSLQSGVIFGASYSQYCSGEAARQKLIDDYGWSISDQGKSGNCNPSGQRPFITTWKTDNPGPSGDDQITIPTASGEVYDYTVDWGDGSSDSGITGDFTHTYASPGTYTVIISGIFPRIHFETSQTDRQKLLTIEQWGDIAWTSMREAFLYCGNLQGNFTDSPDLSNVTDMGSMFKGTSSFNHPIGNWDVSNVTDMSLLFNENRSFNQDINNWNVANVRSMRDMFLASRFNQNISDWNVSNVITMERMFAFAAFNQDISDWNVSSVENMKGMFTGAWNFNQDIGSWDVGNVTDMSYMFEGTDSFDQPIGSWDVSNVTDMTLMFWGAIFNQDIGSWDVSKVSNMTGLFYENFNFNQDIGNWDVGNVTNMYRMFAEAFRFNQDIGNWNVSNVTNMGEMFLVTNFNQDIGRWDVSNVTNMGTMFFRSGFNQDIGAWDVGNVTNMDTMFRDARSFNQDIGDWNVSKVITMRNMFLDAKAFNQDIGSWDVSSVTNMYGLFFKASAFNQNIGSWDVSNVTNMIFIFRGVNFSVENYDGVLIGWSSLPSLQPGIVIPSFDSQYCLGESARQKIIDDYGWTISDGGKSPDCNLGENSARILENTISFNMTVYPNPSAERVTVSHDDTAKIMEFRLYDSSGRLLRSTKTVESGEPNSSQFNVSNLKVGTYFLQAFDSLGRIHQKQLLIRR